MAKYLVTGGCGFIGSHLVGKLVCDGHHVVIIDDLSTGARERIPPCVEVITENVSSSDSLKKITRNVDGVFHLAAIASVEKCSQNWAGSHTTNATGTVKIFEASREAARCTPVVWASSAAVYGVQRAEYAEESAQPLPLSPYGADKLSCEHHGFVASRLFGVPNIGLRFFNVYGPGQDPASPYSGVISIFINKVRNKEPITVNGDGMAVRDFVYVADVVEALLAAMRRLEGSAPGPSEFKILNVCTGKPTRIKDLVTAVCGAAGSWPRITHGPERPGDIRTSVGSPLELKRFLGVECQTAVRDGLARILAEQYEG